MDRATAKREACFRVASVARDSMDDGWPRDHYPEADLDKVIDGILSVIAELERRGWKK